MDEGYRILVAELGASLVAEMCPDPLVYTGETF